MRIDIESKNKFNVMLKKIFVNQKIPKVTGCSINSKNIKKGDLFLPIKGARVDGHDFINEAVDNGAVLILNERNTDTNINALNISVSSVIDTLKKIATKWRTEINCDIIGITGSNGKTSTKELLKNIISKSKKTMFSKGNYNSTFGLPMSILSISDKDEFGILEMGANKSGEIKELCTIAQPTHGLVTNISNSHNKYFGSTGNIAKNKIELLKSLPNNGYAFINMDSSYLKKTSLKSNIVTYGFSDKYDFSGSLINDSVKINDDTIKLPYSNMAIAQNYLAAYSVSMTFGINRFDIIEGLENTPIYPGRGEIIMKNNIIFINDTYNANLASCVNGIESMIKIRGNKKIVILGDMHELGEETKNEHVALGKMIDSLSINAVFGLGQYIKYTLESIHSKKIFIKHFNSKKDLIQELSNYCSSGDVVYVKGSRNMEMEQIIYNKVYNYAV